jgi:hypothetical protein
MYYSEKSAINEKRVNYGEGCFREEETENRNRKHEMTDTKFKQESDYKVDKY